MFLSVQIDNVGPIFDSSFDASYFMLFQAAEVRRYHIDSNSIPFENIFIKQIEMKLERPDLLFRWLHAAGPSAKWNRPNDYSKHKPVVIVSLPSTRTYQKRLSSNCNHFVRNGYDTKPTAIKGVSVK